MSGRRGNRHRTPSGASQKVSRTVSLHDALAHFQSGRLAESGAICRGVLKRQPGNSDALHLLGLAASRAGEHAEAVKLIRRAVELQPDNAMYRFNLGNALREQGAADEAIEAFRTAIAKRPEYPEAYYNLGNMLNDQSRWLDAVDAFERAIALEPAYVKAHANLAHALQAAGRFEDAVAANRRVLAIAPDHPRAHNGLGNALRSLGRTREAVAAFREALVRNPQSASISNNLGNALRDTGQLKEAANAYQQAIKSDPEYGNAYHGIGACLRDLGRPDEAALAFAKAMKLQPEAAYVYNGLGVALRDMGRLEEAIRVFERALALRSDDHVAASNLGVTLYEQGRAPEAEAAFYAALAAKPDYAVAHSNDLVARNYRDDLSPADIYAAHREWEHQHARGLAPATPGFSNSRDPDRRLRIGYVSPDLRWHSVAYFFAPLLEAHDGQAFEFTCYAEVRRPDTMTERLRASAYRWRSTVGLSDEEVVSMVREDGIDILVDLAGHTEDNRLLVFASRAAPVQITWLGYANSTGLSAMDYRVSDAVADPEGIADACTSERLVRLPNGFHCYEPSAQAPAVSPLPVNQGEPFTFGSFNNTAKLSPRTIAVWAEILRAVPNSRLFLKSKQFTDDGTCERYRTQFAEHDIGAERLMMEGRTPTMVDHFARYGRVDLALDPLPYNGTTTTCEALWMGVPVVTLAGDRHAARVGASLLTRIGMKQFIAASQPQYVEFATQLATDRERLSRLRATLRERMARSPLCDTRGFAADIEGAYRDCWRRWCAEFDQ